MTLCFASLGSGSEGNGLLVQHQSTLILVDCGFSLVETERRLNRLGVTRQDLQGILVTHEHSDHMSGVAGLARQAQCPVYGSFGTLEPLLEELGSKACIIRDEESFSIGSLTIHPYAVPHDSREPLQFVITDGDKRLGILTDTGSITPHIEQSLSGCHALLLETNYDPDLLDRGPYPPALKARVRGNFGHLSNEAAAQLLHRLDHPNLRWIVAAHISRKNNTPQLAYEALTRVLSHAPERLLLATHDTGLEWLTP